MTVPLIILCERRTGSNLLQTLLCSHPGIDSRSEVFNTDHHPHLVDAEPEAVLDHFSKQMSEEPGGPKYRVAKVQFEHLRHRGVLLDEVLDRVPNAKVIVLFRKSILAQYVSVLTAQQTGTWVRRSGDKAQPEPTVSFDPAGYGTFAARSIRHYWHAIAQLHRRSVEFVVLSYEELDEERDIVFDRVVWPYLDVAATAPTSSLERQSRTSPEDRLGDPSLIHRMSEHGLNQHFIVTDLQSDSLSSVNDEIPQTRSERQVESSLDHLMTLRNLAIRSIVAELERPATGQQSETQQIVRLRERNKELAEWGRGLVETLSEERLSRERLWAWAKPQLDELKAIKETDEP